MTISIFGEAMLEYHSGGSLGGLRYGGDSLNTAIHLARMGHDVAYVTALGCDPISDALIAAWAAEGLDTRLILRHPDRNPGMYAIHLQEDGERNFLYWRDQSAARDMFSLPGMEGALAHAAKSSLLYFSLISLAILPAEAQQRLIALSGTVRGNGGLVAYDSNFRANLWPSLEAARAVSAQAIGAASIGLPTNSDESEIAGSALEEPNIASNWHEFGCEEVALKAGAKGCYLSRAGGACDLLPASPLEMKDASGAGDAFNAGYLASRLSGKSAEDSVPCGQSLAAWVIQRSGAIPPVDEAAPYRKISNQSPMENPA